MSGASADELPMYLGDAPTACDQWFDRTGHYS